MILLILLLSNVWRCAYDTCDVFVILPLFVLTERGMGGSAVGTGECHHPSLITTTLGVITESKRQCMQILEYVLMDLVYCILVLILICTKIRCIILLLLLLHNCIIIIFIMIMYIHRTGDVGICIREGTL